MDVQRWDSLEVAFSAAREYANPFRDVALTASFTHLPSGRTVQATGFYDGDATWRLRLLPDETGEWRYRTESSDAGLDGHEGTFRCVPSEAPYLRGPLRARGHHFFHADGTPRFLISTRLSCHMTAPDVWMDAVRYLKAHHIERVLFIMGGIAGTTPRLFGPDLDFDRYDVETFRAIDTFIDALRREGMIASPYFYYFNDRLQRQMTPEQDRAYIRYGMARFGAYANVLPVLSNEVEQKFTERRSPYDLGAHDWANAMGAVLKEAATFGLPVTVHNPQETEQAINPGFYTLLRDWPFPWADCMLRQAQVGSLGAADEIRDDIPEQKNATYNARAYARHNELMADLRRYGIPVVNEEPGYEMNAMSWDRAVVITRPWCTQSPRTILTTFWTAATAGAYAMWGNASTYELGDPLPGISDSVTPARLRLLHDVMISLPYWEMEPANGCVSAAEEDVGGVGYRTNYCLAKPGAAYLVFSLHGGPVTVDLAPGATYRPTLVDPRTGAQSALPPVPGGAQEFVLPEREQVLVLRA
jgi:hypothetical protein